MLAKRLPLVSAFAGGCLSGAVLLGLWRAEALKLPSPRSHAALEHGTEPVAPAVAAPSGGSGRANPEDPAHDGAAAEPPSRRAGEDAGAELANEPGSSVADVLSRLEASYRQGLASDRASAPSQPTSETTEASTRDGLAGEEGAVAVSGLAALPKDPPAAAAAPALAPPPATQAVAVPAAAPVAVAPQAVAVPAAAPLAVAPAAVAVPPAAPVAALAPALAAGGDTQPRDVYLGEVHQNVYNGDVTQNVYNGNTRQADLYQMQQLAVLQYQYMQLLALSSYGGFASRGRGGHEASGRRGSSFASSRGLSGSPVYTSSLTNPDNPWGFNFPPTVLAK